MTTPSDKPSITPELVTHIMAYYQRPDCGVGGALHIVLEDGNVDNADVDFCIQYAREQGDAEGERLALILRQMSRTQRTKLYRTRFSSLTYKDASCPPR